jgi:uncharacterized membrane-anchored protein YitT (DUF2179 family)
MKGLIIFNGVIFLIFLAITIWCGYNHAPKIIIILLYIYLVAFVLEAIRMASHLHKLDVKIKKLKEEREDLKDEVDDMYAQVNDII